MHLKIPLEPQVDEVILQKSDTYADQFEIDRLFGMGVITTHEKFSRDLGTQLSAKFCAVLEKEDTKWCSRMASSITVGCKRV